MIAPSTGLRGRRAATEDMPPALELRGVTKAFGDTLANRHVDLSVGPGEIRGLVGENGAGKTTLMNIASGLYRPDSGEIRVNGESMDFTSPLAAIAAGIGMVHQDFALADALSAAENLVLGSHEGRFWFRKAQVEQRIADLAEHYDLPVEPWEPVWRMEPAHRQRVAILSALNRDCQILILDEPTSVLSPLQIDGLLETIRRLAREGRSVVFITHKLREAVAICDRITIMRAGTAIATVQRSRFDVHTLAHMMVGRELAQTAATRDSRTPPASGILLKVSGLCVSDDRGQPAVDGVDLELRQGEIVGLAGVDGNGQRELLAAIGGQREPSAGSIELIGPAAGRAIASIPGDPRLEALAPTLPLLHNVGLRHYRQKDARIPRRWLVDYRRLRTITGECIARFDVRGGGPDSRTGALSGGNLQKLVLARELSFESPVVLATNPTVGLDIAAAHYVRDVLQDARDNGAAILLASSDLDELLQVSDRVAVIFRGKILRVLPIGEATRSRVGALMAGISDESASDEHTHSRTGSET